jgi:RNA polymerase sigma-70 factor (ECF subfamily)
MIERASAGMTLVDRVDDAGGSLEDADLLAEARRAPLGPAFATLYDRHQAPVLGFLVRLLGDRALAEEVLQEAFLRVFRASERFDRGAPFRPWLISIARNAALNALRAEGKVPTADPGAAPEPAATKVVAPVEAVGLAEEVARLRAALLLVPPETRALLLETHHLGLRPAELAASYGCTERTVRNRLHAANQAVAAVLARRRSEGPEGGPS